MLNKLYLHGCSPLFISRKPGGYETVCEAITPDVECAPLLGNCLGQTNYTSLSLQPTQVYAC